MKAPTADELLGAELSWDRFFDVEALRKVNGAETSRSGCDGQVSTGLRLTHSARGREHHAFEPE